MKFRPDCMSNRPLPAGWLALPLALGAFSACDPAPDTTSALRAYQVASKDQLIGGPSALLDVGDFILENDQIRIGVLGAKASDGRKLNSLGPGLAGGSLVDADLVRHDPQYANGNGLDQFAENFPTINLKITDTQSVEVIEDGSNGRAVLRMRGPSGPYFNLLELLDVLCVPSSNGQFITDYILEPGKRYIKLSTTVMMDKADRPLSETDVPPDAVIPGDNVLPALEGSANVVDFYQKGGLIIGDFLLMGGDVDIFAPTIGFDEDGAVADNPNTLVEPFPLEYVAGVGDKVSYGFVAPPGGLVSVPLFSSSMTAAFNGALDEPDWEGRTNYTVERYFIIGEGDVASIVDVMLELHKTPRGKVEGHVIDKHSGEALSDAHVFVYSDPRPEGSTEPIYQYMLTRERMYSEFRTDRGMDPTPDGSFEGYLPVGRWVLMTKTGDRAPSDPVAIEVQEGGKTTVQLAAKSPGNFSFTIHDQFGRGMPAKLTFREVEGKFQAEPMLGESFQSKGYSRVYFSPNGAETITLRPGKYQVMVSRGIEYSLYDTALDTERYPGGYIVIPDGTSPNNSMQLDVTLFKEVDTTGFVSSDFHVHATNSFDSGTPLKTRVLTMAAEGVEFFTGTDHDYITNYEPVIRELGMQPFVSSAVGLEVTTVELGHLLGFPLEFDADARAGGAVDWTELTPTEMIQALKGKGLYGPDQTIAMVAHPRDGILGYFDVYGYNPWTDVVNPQQDSDFAIRSLSDLNFYLETFKVNPLFNHELFTLQFDALELLNAKRMDLIRSATYTEMQEMQDSAVFDEAAQKWQINEPDWMYRILERTLEEQAALDKGELASGYGLNVDYRRGQMEDWFNLLNYGYRISGVGNSDTHGLTSIESGCPRTYVQSSSDEPALIDPREVAESVKNSKAMATYGPFIEVLANGQHGIGSSFSLNGAPLTLEIGVQSASWIKVSRVELYENGRLIQEFLIPDEAQGQIEKFRQTVELTPKKDAWYVVMAMSNQDLSPVFQSVELPYIELDAIIEEALIALENENCAGLFGAPPVFPQKFPVFPYGFTNPIWVDVDGDTNGDGKVWEAPGHASYMVLDGREVVPPGTTIKEGTLPLRRGAGPTLHLGH
ncbi:MAG: hypothetical protein ACKO6N_24920 [Myxococcota bacterium]